jgi:serine phosphatase RsbU (regulator of sigma subunit)
VVERGAVAQALREGRPAGALTAVGLGAALMAVDVVEGEKTQYVGALVAVPLLAASFVPPPTTVVVGALAVLMGGAYGFHEDIGTDSPQLLRLALIAGATAIAAVVSALRVRRERQLADLETIAEVAQQTVLRTLPPVVGNVGIAVRYVSATSAARVGGDFYEASDTAHGVRLLIGDVRGKGLDAVRLASVVLGSFRQAAHTEADERSLVGALDDAVARVVDDEEFVTAIVANVTGTRLRIASAGHPPPLLLPGAGGIRELSSRPTVPLGLGSEPTPLEVELSVGDVVLFYTDGLEEARSGDRWFDVHGEAVAAWQGAADLDEGLGRLQQAVERFLGGAPTDDVALLAIRLTADRAPRGSQAVRRARPLTARRPEPAVPAGAGGGPGR